MERVHGEIIRGVFDTASYSLMAATVGIMIFIIWMAIQLDKYKRFTCSRPTFFQVTLTLNIVLRHDKLVVIHSTSKKTIK